MSYAIFHLQQEERLKSADSSLDHATKKEEPAQAGLESRSKRVAQSEQSAARNLPENPAQLETCQEDGPKEETSAGAGAVEKDKAASEDTSRTHAVMQASSHAPVQPEFNRGSTNEPGRQHDESLAITAPGNVSAPKDWDAIHKPERDKINDLKTGHEVGSWSEGQDILLRARTADMESRLAAAVAELEQAAEQKKMLAAELDSLRKETAAAGQRIAASEDEISSLKAAVLERDAALAAVQLSKPDIDLERLLADCKAARTEASAARADADQQRREAEALRKTLAESRRMQMLSNLTATTVAASGLNSQDVCSAQNAEDEREGNAKLHGSRKADTQLQQVCNLFAI